MPIEQNVLIIFDCDGVLVDSEYIIATVEAEIFTQLGYPLTPAEDIRRFSGKSQKSTLETIEKEMGRRLPEDIGLMLECEIAKALSEKLVSIAGVESLLDMIPKKCVASSSTYPMIKNSLQVTGLGGYFVDDAIFSTSMVKNGKPAPDIFIYAAEKMGVSRSNCVVIEDSIAGVTAAKAAGIKVLGFVGGNHILDKAHAEKLMNVGASRVFDDMSELLRYLSA